MHQNVLISYGTKTHKPTSPDSRPPLDAAGIKRVQGIFSALLCYGVRVDNKLLVALSTIGSQKAAATEATADAIHQLLDYVFTYPNNRITYRSSDMVLAGHSDAGYLNETCSRIHSGVHIFLSENDPILLHNGPILTIADIINFVISSTEKFELAAMFIIAKKMVSLQQAPIEIRWPQPTSPLQTDNSNAANVTNNIIVPRQTKAMDMLFYWLRCDAAQDQFRFFGPRGYQLGQLQYQASPATVP